MMKNTALGVAFAAAALIPVSASAAIKAGQRGHSDFMPLYGPAEDKVCTLPYLGPKKPGDWHVADVGQNRVVVVGNDCRTLSMSIDPDTLKLLSLSSPSDGQPDVAPAGSVPAPKDWWNLPQLQVPQAPPQLIDPYKMQDGCKVRLGNGQQITLSEGMLIVPDIYSAYVLTKAFDKNIQSEVVSPTVKFDYGTQGKPYCTLRPLFTIPKPVPDSSLTVSGGGLHNPGNITVTPPPVTPAAAVLAPVAGIAIRAGTPYIISAFEFLAARWATTRMAYMAGGAVVFSLGVDMLINAREILGLTPDEVGWINKTAAGTEAPTQGEVDDAIRDASQPATEEAERLSAEHKASRKAGGRGTGGKCTPERLEELEERKKAVCETIENSTNINNPLRCSSFKTAFQNLALARTHALCARQRDQIRKECFDGGDDGHRKEASSRWKAVRNCLEQLAK